METSLKKSSILKSCQCIIAHKTCRNARNSLIFVFQQEPPLLCFYTLLVPGQFSHEFITTPATWIHLIGRHWAQLHSVFLILYLVKTAMNRTPNSKMRSAWSINLIQWEAACGWRWNWNCRLEADTEGFCMLRSASSLFYWCRRTIEEFNRRLTQLTCMWNHSPVG